MRSDDIRAQSPSSLLITYAVVLHRLRGFGVIRSFNHPVGDVAEYWVSQNPGLMLSPKSNMDFDAIDAVGLRYQIKARWRAQGRGSTTMTGIRPMEPAKFDFLVAIVFDSDFNVDYAAILPVDQVRRRCRHVSGRNTFAMPFPRRLLSIPVSGTSLASSACSPQRKRRSVRSQQLRRGRRCAASRCRNLWWDWHNRRRVFRSRNL